MKLEITVPAFEDLESIRDYIRKDSPFYADTYIEKILNSIQNIQDFPKIGRFIPKFRNDNIREKRFGNYRIIYQLTPDQINIIAVIHSARKINKIIKQRKN